MPTTKRPHDCGLFAFAFAAVLSSGKHPSAFILINLSCISIFIGALHKDVFCHSLYYNMEEKTGKQRVINTLFMYTATVECQKPFLVK